MDESIEDFYGMYIITSSFKTKFTRKSQVVIVQIWDVTPSFKGKTECIDHVCARIKLHTRLDIMNTKNSATRIKSYYKP
jgi:hypothetical protein